VEFNIAQVFAAVVAANPDRDCIVFGDRRFTFVQTDERARRFARALYGWGLGTHRERAELAPYKSGQSHLGCTWRTAMSSSRPCLARTGRGLPHSTSTIAMPPTVLALLDSAIAPTAGFQQSIHGHSWPRRID
jgi:acyl-CoA synthetase (AMP-forming)/AMP-acid ligase II